MARDHNNYNGVYCLKGRKIPIYDKVTYISVVKEIF